MLVGVAKNIRMIKACLISLFNKQFYFF